MQAIKTGRRGKQCCGGKGDQTSQQTSLYIGARISKGERGLTSRGLHKEWACTKHVKKMYTRTGRRKPAHMAAFDLVFLRKHVSWKPPMLLQPCPAMQCWRPEHTKPNVCTSYSLHTGKGDQELFFFKPYSEILSKADSEQTFFPDHGILNIIFCMCTFSGTSYFFNFLDRGDWLLLWK